MFGSGKGLDYFIRKEGGADLIIGGPPCQAYSVAGRVRDENGMRDDYRNYLFEHYLYAVSRCRPKLFVFDDSFSALDMKTDAKLRAALESRVADSTVIIVAQRISTILHADQILVLDDGKIAGKGTHEQLLRECEVYQQIAYSQLSEQELAQTAGKEAFA